MSLTDPPPPEPPGCGVVTELGYGTLVVHLPVPPPPPPVEVIVENTELLPGVVTIGDKHAGFSEVYSHPELECDFEDWDLLREKIDVANRFLSRDMGWHKQRKSWYGHLGSEQNLMLARQFMKSLPKEVRALM